MAILKVLIVDDYIDNRLLLSQICELMELEYIEAKNGREAMEVLEKEVVSLVFMDIEMPVMNGLETTRAIRKHSKPEIARVKVVAITAHNPESFQDKYKSIGFDSYLTKPYTMDKIEAILKDLNF